MTSAPVMTYRKKATRMTCCTIRASMTSNANGSLTFSAAGMRRSNLKALP